MKISANLLQRLAAQLKQYSQYHPQSLSLQTLLDFGEYSYFSLKSLKAFYCLIAHLTEMFKALNISVSWVIKQ